MKVAVADGCDESRQMGQLIGLATVAMRLGDSCGYQPRLVVLRGDTCNDVPAVMARSITDKQRTYFPANLALVRLGQLLTR